MKDCPKDLERCRNFERWFMNNFNLYLYIIIIREDFYLIDFFILGGLINIDRDEGLLKRISKDVERWFMNNFNFVDNLLRILIE